jgi:hypothetical protein
VAINALHGVQLRRIWLGAGRGEDSHLAASSVLNIRNVLPDIIRCVVPQGDAFTQVRAVNAGTVRSARPKMHH